MSFAPKHPVYGDWEGQFLKEWPQAPHLAIEMIRDMVVAAENFGMEKALNADAVRAEIERLTNEKAANGAERLIQDERRKFSWVQQRCVEFIRAVVRSADSETKRYLIREIKGEEE